MKTSNRDVPIGREKHINNSLSKKILKHKDIILLSIIITLIEVDLILLALYCVSIINTNLKIFVVLIIVIDCGVLDTYILLLALLTDPLYNITKRFKCQDNSEKEEA